MKKIIRRLLVGDIPISEYSTVTVQGDILERVYLETDSRRVDISKTHWLLCLSPVIFGIWFVRDENMISLGENASFRMYFRDADEKAEDVAIVELIYFSKIVETDGTLLLLKLSETRIFHVSHVKALILFHRYYKKPEQDFYKLKSYSAAYSYPRRVRLISFMDGDWYNIFPMDLLGDIPMSRKYVFGLRHSNVTLTRIIQTRKIVVSEIHYEFKDVIYQLGKHHREPISGTKLPFQVIKSEIFEFPVPVWADSYKEIRIIDTMNLGSHMLLWGEEVNEKLLSGPSPHLFHIHFLHYLHQKGRGFAYQMV